MKVFAEYALKTAHTLVLAWLVIEGIQELDQDGVGTWVIAGVIFAATLGTLWRVIWNEDKTGRKLNEARVIGEGRP